jgi:hypothetical protein
MVDKLEAILTDACTRARLDEAYRIGLLQEKGEYLPATYLIDRRAELHNQSNREAK